MPASPVVLASKAARVTIAARGRAVAEFGLRLDSGNLLVLSREVGRRPLARPGLQAGALR